MICNVHKARNMLCCKILQPNNFSRKKRISEQMTFPYV